MGNVKITLCNEKTDIVQVNVLAEITDGCLKISGQDFGLSVSSFFGASEYEYFYDFDDKNTKKLLALIRDKGMSAEKALISRFSGMNGCELLRKFCNANSIQYRFFSHS